MIHFASIIKAIAIGLAIGILFYFVSGSLFTASRVGLSAAALVLGYRLRHLFR
jgi:hypothetical protein